MSKKINQKQRNVSILSCLICVYDILMLSQLISSTLYLGFVLYLIYLNSKLYHLHILYITESLCFTPETNATL
ncbi:hypothetical protein K5549_005291 [Capra hircus]|nr:hypothetical protein K5549_005291 [Capra hircus]